MLITWNIALNVKEYYKMVEDFVEKEFSNGYCVFVWKKSESIGAKPMKGWTVMRVESEGLEKLSGLGQEVDASI